MMKRDSIFVRRTVSSVVAASIALSHVSALAQNAPKAGDAKPPAEAASADPKAKLDEAREHYEKGLKLFEDGAYDAARIEFERAYELSPTYRLLYNIGQVQREQLDYVGAIRSFESYLAEGGSAIPEVRRKEVTDAIAVLKTRVATVMITVNVEGADVFVDDVAVGKSPLNKPVMVNAGRRKISASKPGRIPAAVVLDLAGTDQRSAKLDLAEGSKTVYMDTSRRVPWAGWVTTVVLAAGAGVAGYAALQANSKLNDMKDAGPSPNPDDLSSQNSRVRLYSITADVLTAGAVIAGGISLYYTIKWGKERDEKNMKVSVTPMGISLGASF